MSNTTDILLVGVGGQGTILASKVVGQVALSLGQEVKVAEIHGMSQRGGNVVTQVRYGEKVYSPTIQKNQADIILAFEKIEALRWLPYLKKGGQVVVNDQEIDPMPVIMGKVPYPENVMEQLKARGRVSQIPALELAEKAGNSKTINVVLLGVLAKGMDIELEIWEKVLQDLVPAKFLDVNLRAFQLGLEWE
ncbi:MAG: indolepyruvate oxidoreductase subunit beta [Bacillota bacterium]